MVMAGIVFGLRFAMLLPSACEKSPGEFTLAEHRLPLYPIIHLITMIGPKRERERDEADWLRTASDEELLQVTERLGAKIGKPR
jgi:hypothetical protein